MQDHLSTETGPGSFCGCIDLAGLAGEQRRRVSLFLEQSARYLGLRGADGVQGPVCCARDPVRRPPLGAGL